jgi:hypothetical protein
MGLFAILAKGSFKVKMKKSWDLSWVVVQKGEYVN